MKYSNLNIEETKKLKLGQNSKTQIVIKLKNLIFYETQKLKLGLNSKTQLQQNLTIQIMIKPKYSNCDKTKNSNCDITQSLKL